MRVLVAALAAFAVLAFPATAAADDLIVRFDPATSPGQRAALRTLAGVKLAERLPVAGMEVVSTGSGLVDGVLRRLAELSGVLYAERDARVRRHAVPNDALFDRQYAHGLIGDPLAWDVTTGSAGVTVAVVDSGADLGHPDLRPNLWRNAREVAGNGRDDDANGYVDDVHGYDFAQHDGSPQDADGHGSHVAGIAAASGNDGIGIAGVSWRSSLLALRVLDEEGAGTVSDAIKAYRYAGRAGARVVNVSWGGPHLTRAEHDAIAEAPEVLFVASAGNEGLDVEGMPTYPCAHPLPNVICVAASDRADVLAPFSNRGPVSVDLAAPGVAIESTVPGPAWAPEDGTSMAAPQVSGAAALLFARAPQASVAEVRAALLGTVDRRAGLAGVTATGGRLNVAAAMQAIATVPVRAQSAAPDRRRPRVRIVSLARGGLVTRARCSEACALRVELVRGGRILAVGETRRPRAGTVRVRLRALRALPGRATLRVRATDPAGNVGRASRPVRLRG